MKAKAKPDYTFDEYLERFLAFLSQRKLRNTHERNMILHSVYDSETHFTVDSLKENLHQKKYFVAKTTLYSTLNLLIEADLIIKHYFSSQTLPQYEKLLANGTHNHIYMEDTQQVIDFSDPRIDEIIKDIERIHNVSSMRHSFVVYCEKG